VQSRLLSATADIEQPAEKTARDTRPGVMLAERASANWKSNRYNE
jgi:hypothetical protein